MKNRLRTERAKIFAGALTLALFAFSVFGGEMDKGEAFYLQKQYGKAVECYRKAVELDPGCEVYQENLEAAKKKL